MIPLLPEQKHLKNVSKLGFLAQKGVQAWILATGLEQWTKVVQAWILVKNG